MSEHGPTVFKDRYEVHRKLARGGMSDVYLARDRVLDRPVALKVLFPEYAKDATFVARFRREAQAAARLNHPNIVGVYDWGEETGTYFIAMEYIEGRTLSEIVRAEGPMHPRRAAEATADVAAALGFAHRNGVIHRDVKPGNVMCESTGLIKVADFGIAQAVGGPEQTQLTRVGSVMGTATYFSPEQAQGRQVDPRSDIYSLGCVLFEILTGRPPFTGDTPVAIAYKHVQEPPPHPSSITQVPPALDAIVLKCLAKSPNARYASAEELRTDLRRFLEGQPVAALAGAAAATASAAAGLTGDATAAFAGPVTGANPAYADATSAMPVTGGQPAYPPGATGMTGSVPPYGGPPDQKKPNPWLIGGLVLLLLVVAGGLVALAMNLNKGTPRVRVPSVVDKTYDEAAALVIQKGLVPVREQHENVNVEAGKVFEQSPLPESEADQGSRVTLKVSTGAGGVPVPDVRNKTRDEAVRLLSGSGLQVAETTAPSDSVPDKTVISQDPAPGTSVRAGEKVNIVVSTGKAANGVPEVSGQFVNSAVDALKAAGFERTSVATETSDEFRKDRVTRTNPPAGSVVDKNTVITIYVSSGSTPTSATTVTTQPTTTSKTTTSKTTTTTEG
jgi:serine/threonine-protein kinase